MLRMLGRWGLPATLVVASAATVQAQFPGPAGAAGSMDSFRRGLQDVVRAAGQSQSSSQSGTSSGPTSPIIDVETARGMNYDNQVKYTNTFFEKRQQNRMFRESEKGPSHTSTEYSQWAKDQAPERLSSNQADAYGGRINWPIVLQGEAYRGNREQVDSLYARHTAAGGGLNTPQYADIQRLTKEMQTQLRGQIAQIPAEQYSSARKFLESLRYECRFSTGS